MGLYSTIGTVFVPTYPLPVLSQYIPNYDNAGDAWASVESSWKLGRGTPTSTTWSYATWHGWAGTSAPVNISFWNPAGTGASLGQGNDNAVGTGAADFLYGNGGHDFIHGNGGNDRIYGGTGNDRLFGGAGADHLHGDSGNDKLYGGSGDDLLSGGTGIDLLAGGSGSDTADFSTGGVGWITASLATGTATSADGTVNQTLNSIENLTGSSTGDTLTGNDAANVIDGVFGFDTLDGRGGNDTLTIGTDGGIVHGGAGNDTIVFWTDQGSSGLGQLFGGNDEDTFDLTGFRTGSFDIHGDNGLDTLLLAGNAADWTIVDVADQYNSETGSYENHSLVLDSNGNLAGSIFGIETIRFEDGSIFNT